MKKNHQQGLFPIEAGSIHIENSCIHFRMRKNSRIKKARLVVSPEEGLVVETPEVVTIKRAHKMINRKKQWVLDALESIREKRKLVYDVKQFKNSVLMYGKEKVIDIKRDQAKDYILETKQRIILGFTQKRIPTGLVDKKTTDWLRAKANRYLPLRVRKLNQNKFKINNIIVKDQKTLWGSCSTENNLQLNWRLIMAPRYASDYIILHELCHTKYLNHSKKFWNLVSQVSPSYGHAEKWFNNYGFVLYLNFTDF